MRLRTCRMQGSGKPCSFLTPDERKNGRCFSRERERFPRLIWVEDRSERQRDAGVCRGNSLANAGLSLTSNLPSFPSLYEQGLISSSPHLVDNSTARISSSSSLNPSPSCSERAALFSLLHAKFSLPHVGLTLGSLAPYLCASYPAPSELKTCLTALHTAFTALSSAGHVSSSPTRLRLECHGRRRTYQFPRGSQIEAQRAKQIGSKEA